VLVEDCSRVGGGMIQFIFIFNPAGKKQARQSPWFAFVLPFLELFASLV
jgi:hypothetical protein